MARRPPWAMLGTCRYSVCSQGLSSSPPPGSENRRGRKGFHPLAIFAMVLGALAVLVVVGTVLLIGTFWLACRDSSGSC